MPAPMDMCIEDSFDRTSPSTGMFNFQNNTATNGFNFRTVSTYSFCEQLFT